MPSKTWGIMACNTPIIASVDVDSDLSIVLTKSNGGICVPPDDMQMLKNQIEYSFANKQGCNSRDYVRLVASKTECVWEYVSIIQNELLEGMQ